LRNRHNPPEKQDRLLPNARDKNILGATGIGAFSVVPYQLRKEISNKRNPKHKIQRKAASGQATSKLPWTKAAEKNQRYSFFYKWKPNPPIKKNS